MSPVLDACRHAPAALRAFDAQALAQAMLDVEAALARAWSDAGHLGAADATAIASVCQAALYDLPAWLAESHRVGHPAGPLVHELRQTVRLYRRDAADAVHRGATDDELLDTALALCTARALDGVAGRLAPWLALGTVTAGDAERRAAVRRGWDRLAALRPLALTARWGGALAPGAPAEGWPPAVAEHLAARLGLGRPTGTDQDAEHADRLLLEAALLARELGRGLPETHAARRLGAQALEQAARYLAAPAPGLARHEAWCSAVQALVSAAEAATVPTESPRSEGR